MNDIALETFASEYARHRAQEIDVDETGIYAFFENVGHFPENYNDIPQEVFA